MSTLFSDNAQGYLSATAEQSANVLALSAGEGLEFPDIAPGSGDQFFVRLGTNLNNDIVRILNKVGDLLYTDSPLGRRWPAGTEVSLTLNARALSAWLNEILSVVNNAVYFRDRSMAIFDQLTPLTFTRPEGVTIFKVTAVGGAGGGGGAKRAPAGSGTAYGSRGGFGQVKSAYIEIPLEDSDTVPITVGAGGNGGTSGENGTMGGFSSFGTYLSASGGMGGNGAIATSGDLYAEMVSDFVGDTSFHGGTSARRWGMGPMFAIPHFGPYAPEAPGPNGVGYGAPGLGGISATEIGTSGGMGTGGVILVEW